MPMIQFFPAIVPAQLMAKDTVCFTKKNPFFKHNKFLVSFTNRGKYDFSKWKDPDVFLMGDSGGFQRIGNPHLHIDPHSVIHWQNNQCDIGITLDRPPVINNTTFDLVNYDKYMIESANSANFMMSKKNQRLKLFLAIHGYDTESRQKWLDHSLKEYTNWDAYAIAARPLGDPIVLIDWLMFAKENGLKNIHVLARAGLNSLQIMSYMSKHFKQITFDSSAITFAARQRLYYLPYFADSGKISFGDKGDKGSERDFSNLPCMCNCCREIERNWKNHTPTGLSYFMAAHNIYNLIRYTKYLDALSNHKEVFPIRKDLRDYIDNYDSQKTMENAWG